MHTHPARHGGGSGRLDLDLDPDPQRAADGGPLHALALSGSVSGLTPDVHEARAPDLHDRETLVRWHIAWHMGRYWFGPFCFDDLADAVHYARQQRAHAVPESDE